MKDKCFKCGREPEACRCKTYGFIYHKLIDINIQPEVKAVVTNTLANSVFRFEINNSPQILQYKIGDILENKEIIDIRPIFLNNKYRLELKLIDA